MTNSPTVSLFGMKIDNVRLDEAAERVLDWCAMPRDAKCRYLVTPNVDHAVMMSHRGDLRAAYADAAMVVADGAPLIAASRLLGRALPERVAGSDLVPRLLQTGGSKAQPLRVFLLGAGPGVADEAARSIEAKYPDVQVVGTHCPPLGFENNDADNQAAIDAVNAAQPDLLIIGLGAPKQELWAHRFHNQLQAKVAVCAGATIDFLAGHKQRSPVWMQRIGLEWFHRLATEPRRLAARYARDAWVFPQLVWQEWRAGQTANGNRPAAV